LRQREVARTDLDQFFSLTDEAHFYAASSDSAGEQVPYFDPRRGMEMAERAIGVARRWGPALQQWPLPQELPRFRGELYELILLDAQLRTAARDDPHATLVLLDTAAALSPNPTRGYYRLRAECAPDAK